MSDVQRFEERFARAVDRHADQVIVVVDPVEVVARARAEAAKRSTLRLPLPGRSGRSTRLALLVGAALVVSIIGGVILVSGSRVRSVTPPVPTPEAVRSAAPNLPVVEVGRFVAVGDGVERFPCAVALLDDGRVLLVGGMRIDSQVPGPSEIFDPATGLFHATGAMVVPRYDCTATTLEDGRVLIVGGSDSTGQIDIAEIYDPATGTFTQAGAIRTPRAGHEAARLADGRVLVVGGSANSRLLDSSEIYDPATGAWGAGGSMAVARSAFTATLLEDGGVLLVGGFGGPTRVTPVAEVFDTASEGFGVTGPLVTARSQHAAIMLVDGRVLVVGGTTAPDGHTLDERVAEAEVFNSGTGRFEPAGSLVSPDASAAIARLSDGRVLVGGGESGLAEIYDPVVGEFVAGPRASSHHAVAVTLPDGRVLLPDGRAEVFEPAGWSPP